MLQQLNLFEEYGNSITKRAVEQSCDIQKENGVFYTDIEIASAIVRFLNLDKHLKIFDPNCGVGNFLRAERQLGYQNLWGCDIDKQATSICAQNDVAFHVYNTDTIWANADAVLSRIGLHDKADAVIGNPPYAKLSLYNSGKANGSPLYSWTKKAGNNLFVASMMQAFSYVKEGGVISLIVPKSLLYVNSYKLLRQYILRQKTIVSIVDLGAIFKGVRGEQIVLTMKNEAPAAGNVALYHYTKGCIQHVMDVGQHLFDDIIYFFYNKNDLSLYKKFSRIGARLEDLCTGYVGRGKSTDNDAVAGKDLRKFGLKVMPLPETGNQVFLQNIFSREAGVIASFGGDLKAGQTITVITDGNKEKCKYILGMLHSRVINFYLTKYCYNSSSLTMHTDAKYLKKIPLITNNELFDSVVSKVEELEHTPYLSALWRERQRELDQLFYTIYQLSGEERRYVDEEMTKIQSKKWAYDYRQ